jgi:RNA polymerase sigma factor for flagellar operon FliA
MSLRKHLQKYNEWSKLSRREAFKRKMAHQESGQSYFSATANIPEDVEQLWIDYKSSQQQGNGDVYRKQLIETYLPLVKYHAGRVYSRLPEGVAELDDLVSAGIFGLIEAVEKFDLSRGIRFETYCPTRITGAILDELRRQDFAPRIVRQHASQYNHARKSLEKSTAIPVKDEEIFEELKRTHGETSAIEIMNNQNQLHHLLSLQEKVGETDWVKDIYKIDILKDRTAKSPSQRAENTDFLRIVTRGLTQNERQVIIGYYYLDETLKEIAETLDLSESRISQMHTQIMGKLQKRAEKDERLRDYLRDYMSSKKVA